MFFSETPTTKILIASVPVDLPSDDDQQSTSDPDLNHGISNELRVKARSVIIGSEISDETQYVMNTNMHQDNLTEFTVTFLDFSEKNRQNGTVCNNAVCCNYDVEVSDMGALDGKVNFSFNFETIHYISSLHILSVVIFVRNISVQRPTTLQNNSEFIDWRRSVQPNCLYGDQFKRILRLTNSNGKISTPIQL